VGQLHRPKAPAQCHWCLAGSTACCLQRSLPVLPELLDHWLLLLPACMPACPPSCPLPAALLCPALQIVNETLPALQRLKEEGLVRHIGITGLPLKVYRYVLDRCGGALDLARAGPDMTSHL
jgi:diketogulonate reductase-like aldo/keto reductase